MMFRSYSNISKKIFTYYLTIAMVIILVAFQITYQQKRQFYSYTQKSKLNNVNKSNSKLRKEFTQTAVSISWLRHLRGRERC